MEPHTPFDDTLGPDFIPGVTGPVNADSHPRVYLSGPMSGYPNYNAEKFGECEYELTVRGFDVFNPAREDRLPAPGEEPLPWSEYLRRVLRVLTSGKRRPDAILIMPGWENSRGANLEVFIGQVLGIDIVDILTGLIQNDAPAYHWLPDPAAGGVQRSRWTPPMIRSLLASDCGGPQWAVTAETLPSPALPSSPLPPPVRSYRTVKPGELASLQGVQAVRVDFSDLEFYSGPEPPAAPAEDCQAPAARAARDALRQAEPNALRQAERLIYGDRNADYGHPLEDFTRSAKIWGAILNCEVSPEQVGLCMVGVKISRECNTHKPDNLVDGAGYFGCIDRIKRRKEGKE